MNPPRPAPEPRGRAVAFNGAAVAFQARDGRRGVANWTRDRRVGVAPMWRGCRVGVAFASRTRRDAGAFLSLRAENALPRVNRVNLSHHPRGEGVGRVPTHQLEPPE
jgi:hypothetical protein